MSFRKAVRRNKVSGAMFGSTFHTGSTAPQGADLIAAQQRQSRAYALLCIQTTWRDRHRVGIGRARGIVAEQIEDYRALWPQHAASLAAGSPSGGARNLRHRPA